MLNADASSKFFECQSFKIWIPGPPRLVDVQLFYRDAEFTRWDLPFVSSSAALLVFPIFR
jgi:hypothetical protein